MRIISKFKDYYDCIMAHDQDRETLYVRDPVEVNMQKEYGGWIFPLYPLYRFNSPIFSMAQYVVGFCGHIYSCLAFHYKGEERSTHCYSVEDVDEWFRTHFKEEQFDNYMAGKVKSDWRRGNRIFSHAAIEKHFNKFNEVKGKYTEKFIEQRSPIFLAYYDDGEFIRSTDGGRRTQAGTLVWNDLLSKVEFYRKFDVNQTYQELRMYMSNMAFPEKPIPQLSNDDLAHSKGHGDKYSFRKAPSK